MSLIITAVQEYNSIKLTEIPFNQLYYPVHAQKSFIQIPWNLKRRWQGRLRELVQAWAGVELEQTDMYGMREYTKGARLLTHVDREATHAASLIVNIAQENVTRPWTVEGR